MSGFTIFDGYSDTGLKAMRESHFPSKLLHKGIGFQCTKGQASVVSDRDRILKTIGDTNQLDDTVHSAVAVGALNRMLGDAEWRERYLDVVRRTKVRQLRLDMAGPFEESATNDNAAAVLGAVGAECKMLELRNWAHLSRLPSSIGQLTGLKWLYLNGCTALTQLPESIVQLPDLKKLVLEDCCSLEPLPEWLDELEERGVDVTRPGNDKGSGKRILQQVWAEMIRGELGLRVHVWRIAKDDAKDAAAEAAMAAELGDEAAMVSGAVKRGEETLFE